MRQAMERFYARRRNQRLLRRIDAAYRDGLDEGDDIADVNHFSLQEAGFFVNLDFTEVSFIFHQGFAPAASRKLRTDLTVDFLASLRGCER